jgi:hypothetical protein
MRRIGWFLLPATAALAAAAPASSAVVVRTETTFLDAKKPSTRAGTVLLAGDRLRAELPAGSRAEDGRVVVVFRGDRETVYVLREEDHSYLEIDRTSVTEIGGQIDAVKREMRDQMRRMSPETRERVEQMLGDMGLDDAADAPKPIRAVATGKTASVGGHACREQAIVRGAERLGDLCVADWSALGMKRADLEPVRRLAALQAEVARSIPVGDAASMAVDPQAVAALDGVPVRIRVREKGQPATDTRVVAVERIDAPADAFAPPAGWRKRSWVTP